MSRTDKVVGIINGLDYDYWNPEVDRYLKTTYSAGDFEKKYVNKADLQKVFHLSVRPDVPVFGYVGRLAHQKGFDLVAEAMKDIAAMDMQLIVLGIGEEKYHTMLKSMARHYPDKIACELAFDEGTAHKIYAGSDIFLMPSWYEPCGLSQMISLRYGTIPLAHKTGGLADTIEPFKEPAGEGYGFVFENYKSQDLMKTMKKAVEIYHKKEVFRRMIDKGLALRFSWDKSAQKYKETFQQCLASA